jgi:hypothetical protein
VPRTESILIVSQGVTGCHTRCGTRVSAIFKGVTKADCDTLRVSQLTSASPQPNIKGAKNETGEGLERPRARPYTLKKPDRSADTRHHQKPARNFLDLRLKTGIAAIDRRLQQQRGQAFKNPL